MQEKSAYISQKTQSGQTLRKRELLHQAALLDRFQKAHTEKKDGQISESKSRKQGTSALLESVCA
jgi:hypothetical protein